MISMLSAMHWRACSSKLNMVRASCSAKRCPGVPPHICLRRLLLQPKACLQQQQQHRRMMTIAECIAAQLGTAMPRFASQAWQRCKRTAAGPSAATSQHTHTLRPTLQACALMQRQHSFQGTLITRNTRTKQVQLYACDCNCYICARAAQDNKLIAVMLLTFVPGQPA
jgi:hypothetical protein